MAMRMQVQQQRTHRRVREEDRAGREHAQVDDRTHEITEGLDEILDEIDSLLEENAEEFLQGYVQKGGE